MIIVFLPAAASEVLGLKAHTTASEFQLPSLAALPVVKPCSFHPHSTIQVVSPPALAVSSSGAKRQQASLAPLLGCDLLRVEYFSLSL